MGNCPACLSLSKPPHFSIRDHEITEKAADLLSSLSASSALACDLPLKPVLKPCNVLPTNDQLKGKLYHPKEGTQKLAQTASSPADHEIADIRLKLVKKVRFAEEVMLISASDHQRRDSLVNGENTIKDLAYKNKAQSGILSGPASVLVDQSSNIEVKQSSIVRIKVVITNKVLTALLQTRGKQSSSTHISALHATLQYGSPTQPRPPLEHIQELLYAHL